MMTNDFDVIPASEARERHTDAVQPVAEAFTAMGGDDDELSRCIRVKAIEANEFASIESLLDVQDCVNAGISGDGDGGGVHALAVEVLGSAFGGGEVKGGDPAGKDSVHFLGEWFMRIAGTESCLDMADGDFGVEGGQGAAEGGRGVALNEDDVGFLFGE